MPPKFKFNIFYVKWIIFYDEYLKSDQPGGGGEQRDVGKPLKCLLTSRNSKVYYNIPAISTPLCLQLGVQDDNGLFDV